jgi:hypothetical protein
LSRRRRGERERRSGEKRKGFSTSSGERALEEESN